MKLYAIEHKDGGRWWNFDRECWQVNPCRECVWDEEVVEDVDGPPAGHRLVVLGELRTPELKVGARVVHVDDVDVVCEVSRVAGRVQSARLSRTGMVMAKRVFVLPEEGE